MSSFSLMVHRCTIQRATATNVDGVLASTWADHATDMRCLIQEDKGEIRNTATGQFLQYSAIAFFPAGTDLKPQGPDDQDDRIVISKPARLSGVKFAVKLVEDESGMEDHLTVYLARLPE